MINNINDKICCICLDDINLNTIKCNQCVNRIHILCLSKWGTTCPCCRYIITNYKITLLKIYNFIYKHKDSIITINILSMIFIYFIYNLICNNIHNCLAIICIILSLFISMIIKLIIDSYIIDIEYPCT